MSNLSDNPNPDDRPPARWYARRSNQIIGPMPTEEMVELIRLGRLADYDLVRLEETDDWRKVSAIRTLLMEPEAVIAASHSVSLGPPPSDSPPGERFVESAIATSADAPGESSTPTEQDDERHDAAHAASEALSHMNLARLRRAASGETRKRPRRRVGKSFSAAISGGTSVALTWLLVQIGRSLQLRSVQAALAVTLIAGIVWGVVLPRWPVDSRQLLAQFTGLSEQIEMQRSSQAAVEQWQKLEQEVTAAVGDSFERLSREAGSQRPDLQELRAAAEFLPAAVREGYSGDSGKRLAASKLAIHLENAERHIARRAEVSAKMPQTGGSSLTGDAMFWTIVFVDVLLGAVVLMWGIRTLIRRWGSRGTPTAA